jgi:hypothetical protein
VKKVVWFRLKPVFTQMVDELYALRDKSRADFDVGLSELAKLFGNSLYGKFAMRQERMQIVFAKWKGPASCFLCQEAVLEETHGLCKSCEGSKPASDHSGDVWYQKKKTDASYIIPHISAWITALARVRLWMSMKAAIVLGGKIFYSDTDSLLTDVDLPTSTELGGLKDEYPGADLTGTFVQPKVYMLESETFEAPKVTMKGFPYRNMASTHAKDPITKKPCSCAECIIRCKDNLVRLQAGETLEWKQLEKVRTLAALGFSRGPLMKKVSKSFRGKYDKRVINEDGISTRAVVLDEREVPEHLFHDEAAE